MKNLFVLAPLVFARELLDARALGSAALALLCFCLLSSAVYLINDLRDRERDRKHPLKRKRPLAAGTLSPRVAVVAAVVLIAAAAVAGLGLGAEFAGLLGVYVAQNVGYSFWLKRVVILDVMVVALGYVVRVLAGGSAIGVSVSSWLLLCTTFLALFLTFSKRRHELVLLQGGAADQREVLARYSPVFLDQMINVVTASTLITYVLYTVDASTVAKFGSGRLVFTVPFVLFGIFRYLYLVYLV